VAGGKALIGRRAAEAVIEHQDFVQQGRAASPVADDEHGRIGRRRLGQLPPKPGPAEWLGQRVEGGGGRDGAEQAESAGGNLPVVLPQQIKPDPQRHAMPEPRAPPRVGVVIAGRLGGGGHGRSLGKGVAALQATAVAVGGRLSGRPRRSEYWPSGAVGQAQCQWRWPALEPRASHVPSARPSGHAAGPVAGRLPGRDRCGG